MIIAAIIGVGIAVGAGILSSVATKPNDEFLEALIKEPQSFPIVYYYGEMSKKGGSITSLFGNRIHPIYNTKSFHGGIDLIVSSSKRNEIINKYSNVSAEDFFQYVSGYETTFDENETKLTGLELFSWMDGTIVVANRKITYNSSGAQTGCGLEVMIDHGDVEVDGVVTNVKSRYCHLDSIRDNIQVGVNVSVGEVIGIMGNTGGSTGRHLHYEIRLNDKKVDPKTYLDLIAQNSISYSNTCVVSEEKSFDAGEENPFITLENNILVDKTQYEVRSNCNGKYLGIWPKNTNLYSVNYTKTYLDETLIFPSDASVLNNQIISNYGNTVFSPVTGQIISSGYKSSYLNNSEYAVTLLPDSEIEISGEWVKNNTLVTGKKIVDKIQLLNLSGVRYSVDEDNFIEIKKGEVIGFSGIYNNFNTLNIKFISADGYELSQKSINEIYLLTENVSKKAGE